MYGAVDICVCVCLYVCICMRLPDTLWASKGYMSECKKFIVYSFSTLEEGLSWV